MEAIFQTIGRDHRLKLSKWNKNRAAASLLLIVALSLSACQNKELAQLTPEPVPASAQEEQVPEEEPAAKFTA
ncbi:hypothetical protein BZG24_29375, partial [Escherichia coli]|nr:hypothetical protein [Escherichia coli]